MDSSLTPEQRRALFAFADSLGLTTDETAALLIVEAMTARGAL
jgi:hypothetical protein